MSEPTYVEIAAVGDVPDKGFIIRAAEGAEIVLCRVKEDLYAVENRCSHAFQTFEGGRLRGTRLMCPLHGACFDITSGTPFGPPATRSIRSFAVRIEAGRILVAVD